MNKDVAFVFPGQGSQKVGMLSDVASEFDIVIDVFNQASSVLGYDLWQIVKDESGEKLNQTIYTQPAMLVSDIAMWRKAQQRDQDYKPSSFPVSYVKEGNPLDIEIRFMEMRWIFIEEMERDQHFDLGILILYYLKLQILSRMFKFNKEEGLKKFQKLYEVNV